MSDPVSPEAVEAARLAHYGPRPRAHPTAPVWEYELRRQREAMRAAIEAALPHLAPAAGSLDLTDEEVACLEHVFGGRHGSRTGCPPMSRSMCAYWPVAVKGWEKLAAELARRAGDAAEPCVVCGAGPQGRCDPPDEYEGDCPHGCSPER